MPRFFKHMIGIMLVILIAGCAGGGCSSGCAGCGMTPLPGGFEPTARIENAGSVRLTDSGITFLEKNLGPLATTALGGSGNGGVITFPVPESNIDLTIVTGKICPGGPDPNASPPKCVAEIDIGKAQLNIDTATPHNVKITGPLPLRLANLPVSLGFLGSTTARLTGNGCNTPSQYANVDLDVDISVEVDTDQTHSRYGYSRVKVNKLDVNKDQLQSSLNFCGGFTGSLLNTLKPLLFNLLYDQLIGTLGDQLTQQLCQQADPTVSPSCPKGTNDVDGVCRYGTDGNAECVGILLGTEGRLDLSGALASISPGTTGGLDILFAVGGPSQRPDNSGFAWGDLNPIGAGATLGMYGGGEPHPISQCVNFSQMAVPTGIPIPLELEGNTVTDWPAGLEGPHVGIGLSERYANYALNSVYNSGFLCLGISTETVPQLSSGTLALLASSLKDLGLQREAQQVALVIRPGQPPKATFGNGTDINTDPVIRVQLPQASFDFYIWSTDRFIRFMTATFDLDVPVNLAVTNQGLLPVLDKIGVTNGKVTNSELLREDPAVLAASLQSLLGSLAGQFLGGISPIDLSSALSSLGLTLTIPETVDGKGSPGLRKLTRDNDNFLGIFATLGTTSPLLAPGHTTVSLLKKEIDPAGVHLSTINDDNAPAVDIQMSSPFDNGTQAVEYSYRVDDGAWKPFTRERMVTVNDAWLRLQGKHTISARSRVVGHPESMDETPAKIDVVIDVEAPVITISDPVGTTAAIEVRDPVSGGTEPRARYRLDDGAWSAWTNALDLTTVDVGDAAEITVEAEDAEGNIATATQALIRGRAIATGAGCGCSVVGQEQSQSNVGWLLGLGMLGAALRFARRRSDKPSEVKRSSDPKVRATTNPSGRRALRTLTALSFIGVAGSFSALGCSDDGQIDVNSQDGYKCEDPCITLYPGLVGAYTSVATQGTAIWVAGYAEADWSNEYSWGDLVVGKWNGTNVDWAAVDGVPAEPVPDPKKFNKNGFRGGQVEPGDDVGLWTSIAVDSERSASVAYYDRTNKALKFAQQEGTSWRVVTVESKAQSDIGRYAKLLIVGGKPTIAYLSIEPGADGAVTSKVRLATATTTKPTEADWTFEDVAVNNATPCRAYYCGTSAACVVDTNKCETKLTTCDPKCSSGSACVDIGSGPACADVRDASKIDTYPEAFGDYIALAADPAGGLGLAFYDRIKGNLVIASKGSGMWTTMVVDGEDDMGADNGDVGIGASLFIDEKSDWHISYADGLSEGLKYAQVTKGTTVKMRLSVDSGLTVDGMTKFSDGQHIIGDDSSIYVGPSGEVHISYQDATAGQLRHAVGTPTGDQFTWKLAAITQEGFAGAFSKTFISDGKLMIANWWRMGGDEPKGDVAILSP